MEKPNLLNGSQFQLHLDNLGVNMKSNLCKFLINKRMQLNF